MTISPRQRFWLQLLLTVTFPAWALPVIVVLFAWEMAKSIWQLMGEFLDGESTDDLDWDGP